MKMKDKNISSPLVKEDFYNPFNNEDKPQKKTTAVSDPGGLLKIRKESFNPSRVEFIKKGKAYAVLARTHFGAGETVEIAPVVLVGSEVTAIEGLKEVVYEIDKNKEQYGIVLGLGSLYGHSDEPNLSYAYNRKTQQMHYITTRIVKLGEELTINYGKDYWIAKKDFGLMGDREKPEVSVTRLEPQLVKGVEESEIQPNSADNQEGSRKSFFGDPKSKANPVISGVAIKGLGQQ